MRKVSSFRELVVWQKAMAMASLACAYTRRWPAEHRFGMASQIQRSAVSVPPNIAEDHERRSRAGYLRFLAITAGSLAELKIQVRLAAVGITSMPSQPLIERIHEVARILRGIERGLEAPESPHPRPDRSSCPIPCSLNPVPLSLRPSPRLLPFALYPMPFALGAIP
jgi:four helix bundle protein